MGEVKDFMANTVYVWAFVCGTLLTAACLGLPLWVLLYSIYWVL